MIEPPCTESLPSATIPESLDRASAAPSRSPELDVLAQLARAQLERDIALLEVNLAGLRQVWAALRSNDQQSLRAVLNRQAEQEQLCEKARQERHHFQQRAAAILGLAAEDVHVGLVIRNLRGEAASSLEQLRQGLRQRFQEAEELRKNIANLTSHCLNFLNRFLLDLTGGAAGGRYGPTGIRAEAVSGALLQVRG